MIAKTGRGGRRYDWDDPDALRRLIVDTERMLRRVERTTAVARQSVADLQVLARDVGLVQEEARHQLEALVRSSAAADFEARHPAAMKGDPSPCPEVSRR